MRVEDIMSEPAVTVPREMMVHDAIEEMLRNRVGSVVVVADGNAVGIMTRSDALRAAYHAGCDLREIPVSRAMSEDLLTTKRTRTLRSVLRTMEKHNIKKLPVVDGFEPVGIVTMSDIAHHLPEEVQAATAKLDRSDDWNQSATHR
ncbi:CBS domain-containing protein [Halovenus sp. HT40]|uniref:CBS domain-containing protein n=1 Tax=Halovenus sp. HT40 TaxID=3126691 RepID=UPI00300EC7F1